jgi:uncharacterized protein (DUF1501 family)
MGTLDRRQFLSRTLGAGAVASAAHLGLPRLGDDRAASAAMTRSGLKHSGLQRSVRGTSSVARGPFVLCTLSGGNDGLNTVVPYADSNYLRLRGDLAIPADQVLTLGTVDGTELGFHPSLTGLYSLFGAGQVAIILGVEYPNPNYSHFLSMDIWQTAELSGDGTAGWIGRWLDATGTDPLRALSVGPTLPTAFVGQHQQASTLNDSTSGNSQVPGQNPQFISSYGKLMTPYTGALVLSNAVASAGSNLLTVGNAAQTALNAESVPTNLSGRNAGDIGNQFDIVAELIEYGLPTQAYGVSWGSFDTHSDQLQTHAGLLSQLDAAVQDFMGVFPTPVAGKNPVVMIHSEFGRRPDANGSAGTDHSSAGVVLVAGPGVKGGFYGAQPNLAKLDAYGNLVYTTDFRTIYATILEEVLDYGSASTVLGGNFTPIAFLT